MFYSAPLVIYFLFLFIYTIIFVMIALGIIMSISIYNNPVSINTTLFQTHTKSMLLYLFIHPLYAVFTTHYRFIYYVPINIDLIALYNFKNTWNKKNCKQKYIYAVSHLSM